MNTPEMIRVPISELGRLIANAAACDPNWPESALSLRASLSEATLTRIREVGERLTAYADNSPDEIAWRKAGTVMGHCPNKYLGFNPSDAAHIDQLLAIYGPEDVYAMAEVLKNAALADIASGMADLDSAATEVPT